jgi:hypothetical protein
MESANLWAVLFQTAQQRSSSALQVITFGGGLG